MKKVCIVEQSCGLGDILLSSKIGCHYAEEGYDVVWPVEPIYKNLRMNITNHEKIKYPCVNDLYDYKMNYETLKRTSVSEVTHYDNIVYAPLRRAWHSSYGEQMKTKVGSDEVNMFAKFGMCGLDYSNWQSYFSINRDLDKEHRLMERLQIKESDSIHIVNREFGTPPRWREVIKREIETPSTMKRIEMKIVDGFDLFDWISIFEMAEKIDTVTTSNFYIFEKIKLNCIPTIYSKNNSHRSFEDNWNWMIKLASKEYKYIC